MTPEERIAETLLPLADRERLNEWSAWRLRETRSMLKGARMAFIASGRCWVAPIDTACSLIEGELTTWAKLYE